MSQTAASNCNTGKERTLTFADIPTRERALHSDLVRDFLSALPDDIRSKCTGCYLQGDIISEENRAFLDYLCTVSDITDIIRKTPSSAHAFEYLYQEKEAKTPIDRYYVDCLAGSHVNMRLAAFWENMPRWLYFLREKFPDAGEILIDNIGSGPGHEMIGVLKRNPEISSWIHVRNIDKDREILEIGQRKARSLGFEEAFEFAPKKAHEVEPRGAHAIILMGILCTTEPVGCIEVLSNIRFFGRNGGLVAYSTNQESMVRADPFTDFVMRTAGWHMDYKTDIQSWDLARQAGLKPVHQFFEDGRHFQCMTVAAI